MSIRVSVVVPTYRRPELLARCLAALLAQDLPPSAYEIIVADDAADPAVRQLVESHAGDGRPRLRYLPVTDARGPAAARNRGWRAAEGAIIAFTDDDCIPHPNWLREGAARFVNGEVGLAGRIEVPLPSVLTDSERSAAHLSTSRFVTANCFYRRDALEAVGGFDERFLTAWREDSDLFFRMMERFPEEDKLVYAPEATVSHPIRPERWGSSLRRQRKCMFNALLYKKHPEQYRRLVQHAPPWHYYRAVAALLLAAGALALGYWIVALPFAVAWVWMTGRFAAERLRDTSHAPGHVAEMIVTSALIPPLAIFWRLCGAARYRVWFL